MVNTASATFTDATGASTTLTSLPFSVEVVEPDLDFNKLLTSGSPVQATPGFDATYELSVSHSQFSTGDAFDLVIEDALELAGGRTSADAYIHSLEVRLDGALLTAPADYDDTGTSIGSPGVPGGNNTIAIAGIDLPQGSQLVITYSVTVVTDISADNIGTPETINLVGVGDIGISGVAGPEQAYQINVAAGYTPVGVSVNGGLLAIGDWSYNAVTETIYINDLDPAIEDNDDIIVLLGYDLVVPPFYDITSITVDGTPYTEGIDWLYDDLYDVLSFDNPTFTGGEAIVVTIQSTEADILNDATLTYYNIEDETNDEIREYQVDDFQGLGVVDADLDVNLVKSVLGVIPVTAFPEVFTPDTTRDSDSTAPNHTFTSDPVGEVYTITRADGGDFFVDGFLPGDTITVSGTVDNDAIYTVSNVAADTITVLEFTTAEATVVDSRIAIHDLDAGGDPTLNEDWATTLAALGSDPLTSFDLHNDLDPGDGIADLTIWNDAYDRDITALNAALNGGVQPNHTVTFGVFVENVGSDPVWELQIGDISNLGDVQLSSVRVYLGDGTEIDAADFTATGSLGSGDFAVRLLNQSLAAGRSSEGGNIDNAIGTNVAIITYNVRVRDDFGAFEPEVNTATVDFYTAVDDGTSDYRQLEDPDPAVNLMTDVARVEGRPAVADIEKEIIATNQVHTGSTEYGQLGDAPPSVAVSNLTLIDDDFSAGGYLGGGGGTRFMSAVEPGTDGQWRGRDQTNWIDAGTKGDLSDDTGPGQPINVDNYSFEAEGLGNGGIQDAMIDWTENSSNARTWDPPDFRLAPNAGSNVARIDGATSIFQEITDSNALLTEGRTYVLEVEVWDERNATFASGYDVELRSATTDTVLASANETTDPVEDINGGGSEDYGGSFSVVHLEYTVQAGDPFIGEQLEVYLSGDGGGAVMFDNVRLTYHDDTTDDFLYAPVDTSNPDSDSVIGKLIDVDRCRRYLRHADFKPRSPRRRCGREFRHPPLGLRRK